MMIVSPTTIAERENVGDTRDEGTSLSSLTLTTCVPPSWKIFEINPRYVVTWLIVTNRLINRSYRDVGLKARYPPPYYLLLFADYKCTCVCEHITSVCAHYERIDYFSTNPRVIDRARRDVNETRATSVNFSCSVMRLHIRGREIRVRA